MFFKHRYWVGFEGPNQIDFDPNDIENSLAIQELAKLLTIPIEALEFSEDKFNYEIATSKAAEIKAGVGANRLSIILDLSR